MSAPTKGQVDGFGHPILGKGGGVSCIIINNYIIPQHNDGHLGEDGGDTEEEEAGHDHDDGCDVETGRGLT